MKHLRKFNSVSEMNTVIANSTIGILGLAFNGSTPVLKIKSGGSPVPPAPDPTTPFYIEDVSGSSNTVQITKSSSNAPTLTIEKSTDGETWESMGSTSTTAITATVPANGKLYLRCNTTSWCNGWNGQNGINTTGNCNLGGNIMSLLYGSNFTGNETTFPSGSTHTFHGTFDGNSHIIDPSNLLLPSTTMTDNCYTYLFKNCTSLISAPVLPATTLAYECYRQMFAGCTSLTTAPELPITTLADDCYIAMFMDCTSLASAPALPATTLASECYQEMFAGCTSLTTAPALPATTLTNNCYSNMFNGCTSLTTAPELPATTLAQNCYGAMFNGCTSLTTAPELPATTLANGCYQSMFKGCTLLTTTPDLLATTLVDQCYRQMFYNCTNLNYIKCLATYVYANECVYQWAYGVAVNGTFVKDPNITTSQWGIGIHGIPEGWTVQDAS